MIQGTQEIMEEKVVEIIKSGLQHSTAQTFLIFSGLLIVISMLWAKEYIHIAFFTFFYAWLAHCLTAIRRHESLGSYAVGGDKWQVLLFCLAYISLFIWWAVGAWFMLFNFYLSTIPLIFVVSPRVFFFVSIIAILLMAIWFVRFFLKVFLEKVQ